MLTDSVAQSGLGKVLLSGTGKLFTSQQPATHGPAAFGLHTAALLSARKSSSQFRVAPAGWSRGAAWQRSLMSSDRI